MLIVLIVLGADDPVLSWFDERSWSQ